MIQNRIKFLLFLIATLLGLAAVADAVSSEMQWSLFDYFMAGVLLFAAGFSAIILINNLRNRQSRLIALVILAIAFVLIWGELAVGLFGTPWAGN